MHAAVISASPGLPGVGAAVVVTAQSAVHSEHTLDELLWHIFIHTVFCMPLLMATYDADVHWEESDDADALVEAEAETELLLFTSLQSTVQGTPGMPFRRP